MKTAIIHSDTSAMGTHYYVWCPHCGHYHLLYKRDSGRIESCCHCFNNFRIVEEHDEQTA